MYCKKCGTQNPETNAFCEACGSKLTVSNTQKQKSTIQSTANVHEQVPFDGSKDLFLSYYCSDETKKRIKTMWVVFILYCIWGIFATITYVLYAFVTKKSISFFDELGELEFGEWATRVVMTICVVYLTILIIQILLAGMACKTKRIGYAIASFLLLGVPSFYLIVLQAEIDRDYKTFLFANGYDFRI